MRFIVQITSLLLIFFLTACDPINKDLNIQLVAVNDDFDLDWQTQVTLNIITNDLYQGNVDVVITSQPLLGTLKKTSNGFIYTPSKKDFVEDSFKYKLHLGNVFSPAANVNISLRNNIKSVYFDKGNILSSEDKVNVVIETIFTLKNDLDVIINRYINNSLDLNFEPISTTLEVGKDKYIIPYNLNVFKDQQFEINHKFELTAKSFSDQKYQYSYTFLNIVEPEKMFLSIKNIWYNQGASNLMLSQRGLVMSWMNYPVWNIPTQPLWSEDPFKNNSWQLYYHSLYWLFAYEYAFVQSLDERYLDIIGDTILDYFQKSPKKAAKSYMSWDDHSVSWRTDVVSYFYNKYFRDRWDKEKKLIYFKGLDEHAIELRSLLDNPLFDKNNHGMFHALSLYNLAHTFPKRTFITDYKKRSLERIFELFENMVDVDTGVSLEQATHYQLVSIELFIIANKLIQDLSGSENIYVNNFLKTMVDYTAHLIYPNGEAPSVGDSNYGHKNYLPTLNKYLENTEINSEYLNYVNSKGEFGHQLKQVYLSKKAGYSILRPSNNYSWEDQTVIFSDFGKVKYAHGHQDAMSFTAYSNGVELIVDSGGPYVYLPPGRTYFWSKQGHNSLIINGESFILNDAELLEAKCVGIICYSFGFLNQNGNLHYRLIFTIENNISDIYIFDYVDSSGINEYELIYHFPPTSEIVIQEKSDEIIYSENKKIKISVISSEVIEREYYNGFESSSFKQGWVSPKYAKQTPAPVITYKSTSDFYWSLTEISQNDVQSTVNIISDAQEKDFQLLINDVVIKLNFMNANEPTIKIAQ